MLFFLDTANLTAIQELAATGLVDGVTTNPSLVAKEGVDFPTLVEQICGVISGPVSAEVTTLDGPGMLAEGRVLASIAPNVVVKVPLTPEGLWACKALRDEEIDVNVTLCFSPLQALMAAKAGATYVSPFVGRLDDVGHDGIDLLQQICTVYDNYPDLDTMILAASLRHPKHVLDAAMIGVDVVTIPPKVMYQLIEHPLTDKGVDLFMKDWASMTPVTPVAPAAPTA